MAQKLCCAHNAECACVRVQPTGEAMKEVKPVAMNLCN